MKRSERERMDAAKEEAAAEFEEARQEAAEEAREEEAELWPALGDGPGEPEAAPMDWARDDDDIAVQRTVAVVQQTKFRNQLVLDVDFSIANPISISHSFRSDTLFVAMVNIGVPGDVLPAVTFTSSNSFSLTTPTATGKFRVYITVIPS